ncbi:MAG: hypothetical protein KGY50_05520, partial [Candidatus Thermoplasmatota archaeon]|nr:hypothetical protein [Candidatus Thermoplasmatota archaeon]
MRIKNIYIPPGYPVVAIIIAVVLTGSILLYSEDSSTDNEMPTLTVSSKDFSVFQGEQAEIMVNYSDNEKVTDATLFYRKETESSWESVSIIDQSYTLEIANDETKNYQYYVTVNDKAGNGPVGEPSADGSTFYSINVLKQSTSDENVTINRAVFIEEATATWCSNCPEAAEIIHDSYTDQTVPFYYVSMVEDKNEEAKNRLENEFNIYGYPTVYFDGGYKTIVGAQNIIDNFDSTLNQAANRPAPKIKITVESTWNNTQEELTNTIYIKNYEKTTYTGNLKVYINEIKSQWTNYNGESYHFSFLDYGFDQSVSIAAGENKSFSGEWIAKDSG